MELKKYKLGELLDKIENGAVVKQNKVATGIPITRIETLSKGVFNRDKLGYADIYDPTLYANYLLEDNDLLMSHINSKEFVGRTVIYKKQVNECIIHGMNLLRIKTNAKLLDPEFAYYYFQTDTIKRYLYNLRKDAIGQSSIAISDIKNMVVSVPEISIQKKIAFALRCYDRKIELNRAVNQNLEAMAKQLYDYWFVQFDFPNEEGKPYKSSGGNMVWNEKLKRNIPKGWNVVNLSDILYAYTEKMKSHEVNAATNYAPIEVIPRRKMSFNECAPIENAVSGLCRFYKSDILFSNRRVYFHKVSIAPFDGITRDTVIVLKPVSDNNLGYSYEVVNDDMFIEYATRHSYGTEQPVLSWESAKFYKVIKPSNDLDIVFSKKLQPIIDQVLNNEIEISHLMKQRDQLLPLLMNGQVSPLNCD